MTMKPTPLANSQHNTLKPGKKSPLKKIFKVVVIFIVFLLLLLITAPLLFKGKIIEVVKTEINKNIDAKVDFADVDISLIRKFPRVSAAIEKLQIIGNDQFSTDTLLSASKIDVALHLMSFIRGDKMKIYSIDINDPRIQAIVAKDGKANWDIMKTDSTASESEEAEASFNLELNRYVIRNGYVAYRDSSAGIHTEVLGLNHEGSGDFTADLFTLKTKTTTEGVNFTYGPVPYLVNTKTNINADIEVDNQSSKYSFTTDEISLNELKLSAKGFFQIVNDSSYNMDISFDAPSTDFKNILSLVPLIYQKDFAKIKTSGKAIFNGFVKGVMEGEKLPAYQVNLDVANGFFQYPDLPAPVKNINIKMKVDNPDGVTDHTIVDIANAHFEMENDPFDLRLLLKTPVSNMWVDMGAKGKIDLSKITRMVKLDEGTTIKGLLNADLLLKGYIDAVQKQQFEQFNASGTLGLNEFLYASPDYPDGVALNKLLLTFNPRNVTLNEAAGKYLGTQFDANGAINNLLGYALKNEPLDGVVNLRADRIDVNKFMGTSADSTENTDSTSGPFVVPAKLDMLVNAQAGEVKYDNLLMQNVNGSLHLANETVKLNNVKGNALGGTIAVSGSYSTLNNKKKPAIALQYDVENLDIQKTFNTFNTVQKLMPIGKFLGGKLSSKLSMTGNLSENMFPDLASLSGNGNVLLIEGLLQKFTPLDQLADRLNVNELKNISLKEIREQFEFNNGQVLVQPFKVNIGNIDMEVGGTHSFDQSINYALHLTMPRSLMGNKANDLVNDLVKKATDKGVPVNIGETISINAKMLGTILKPDIRLDLKETAGSLKDEIKDQAKQFVQSAIDSSKKAFNDTLQSVKKEVIKEASEKLKAELFGKKDSLTTDTVAQPSSNPVDRLKESGKGLIENINPFKKKN